MNLLKDPWIPIRKGTELKQIAYKELLCTEQPDLQIALPRDDLELACIQMLAAMTQVIFMPADRNDLRVKIKNPIAEQTYDESVKKYDEWFDLEHPEWPFMQTRGVNGKPTSMQKLMIGMPEESSTSPNAHCFFNEPFEIISVCSGVSAIALFNQASNSPSFGGGFKGSLRGAGPISTMVMGHNLRQTAWKNVLPLDKVKNLISWYDDTKENDKPVWVEPIQAGKIQPHSIGLLRGLFWQPAHLELVKSKIPASCDLLGGAVQSCYTGFKKERYGFEIEGSWPHPYSPRQFESDGSVKYLAFKGEVPAWTQMSEFLFCSTVAGQPGYSSAAVVAQHSDTSVNLLVGGYKVEKGASIVYRRHELYSLPAGWSEDFRENIEQIIAITLKTELLLVNKTLYAFINTSKDKSIKGFGNKIHLQARTLFYHFTEPLIHLMLRESSLREFIQTKNVFLTNLSNICNNIFERVTQPYAHKPEVIGTIALARVKLRGLLKKLVNEHTVTGGN